MRSLHVWAAVALVGFFSDPPTYELDRPQLTGVQLAAAATRLGMPNPVDSNSPAVWIGDDFYVFNSTAGQPRRAQGTSIDDAADMPSDEGGFNSLFSNAIGSGRWLESVIRDEDTGRLYGWYHNEPEIECPQGRLSYPRIGAAISDSNGAVWDDLGIVLTARDGTMSCDTEHPVTAGGVGDFSVILDGNTDPSEHYAYFVFSNYSGDVQEQGISFGRMLWSDRDQPLDRFSGQSQVLKWYNGTWSEPGIGGASTPVFDDPGKVTWASVYNNGYWGPSVHWNTYLNRFVMLMDRSDGGNYHTEGVYMSTALDISNPDSWIAPTKILDGNRDKQGWYPQVIGDADGHGTDKLAGRTARYFNSGQSNFTIVFDGPGARVAVPDSSGRVRLLSRQ
jgi:hypothetical protein